jgi:hypothetical protein
VGGAADVVTMLRTQFQHPASTVM